MVVGGYSNRGRPQAPWATVERIEDGPVESYSEGSVGGQVIHRWPNFQRTLYLSDGTTLSNYPSVGIAVYNPLPEPATR